MLKTFSALTDFQQKADQNYRKSFFTGTEASSVTKLKNAGALIAGKTVTTEFAYFQPGPTRNPNNTNHTPGGSSSGSAAAVAAGLVPFATGTQTIGSVSRPAAFCGIIGFKPSYGRIATDGVIPFSESADHIGFFTQDIEGASIAASVLCTEWDRKNTTTKSDKPVLGIPVGAYMNQTEPEAIKFFENYISILEQQGFTIRRIPLLNNINEINSTHRKMISAELAHAHEPWFEKHKDLYSPTTVDFILEGQMISNEELKSAQSGRLELRALFEKTMDDEKIDLYITPSAPGPAPEGIGATGNPCMNLPWTYSGLPTIAIPTISDKNKLPLGVQLTGRFMKDEQLVTLCRTLINGIQ